MRGSVCVFVCVCDARIISIHPAYYVESMCAREYAAYVSESEIVICAFFYDSLKKQSWYSKYIRDSTLTSISAVRWIYLERTDLTP